MGLPYFTSLTGLGILYFLYRYAKTTNVNPRRLPLPPGPKRYPLIGSILDVPPSRPWLVYDEWFKTYGNRLLHEGPLCYALTFIHQVI